MNLLGRLSTKADKIAFILLNVIFADVCIFGAGRLIEFGPLTFRMFALALLLLICIPLFIKNFKELLKSNYIRVILLFGILLVFSTGIGILNNNRTGLILTDIKGFAYFAFLPCAVVLMNSRERIITVSKVTMFSAAFQAMFHMVLVCLYVMRVPWLEAFCDFCKARRFFYVSYKISQVNVRVSFLSLICLLLGVVFSIYFGMKATKKSQKLLHSAITAVCGFSLLMSYTRSVYLAIVLALLVFLVVLFIILDKKDKIVLLKGLAVFLIIFCLIIAGFHIATGENYFIYGLSRALVGIEFFDDLFYGQFEGGEGGDDLLGDGDLMDSFHQNTMLSDNLRAQTVKDLIANIKKSPIIGLGLGAELPSRPDGLNEYFFLDLFSKMGIIGLGCFLSPLAFMFIELLRYFKKNRKEFIFMFSWFCVLLGLIAYSYFTPCMNSSVGIMIYCAVIAVFEFYKIQSIKSEV